MSSNDLVALEEALARLQRVMQYAAVPVGCFKEEISLAIRDLEFVLRKD